MRIKLFHGDKAVWAVFFLLCIISVVEVASAGSYLVIKEGSFAKPILQQSFYVLLSICVAWMLHQVPIRYMRPMVVFGPLVSIALLIWALVGGQSINGGARWVSLFGLISFQPSEIAKGAMVIYAAGAMGFRLKRDGRITKKSFYTVMGMLVIICTLIVTQNFSTAALLFISISLMFVLYQPPRKAFFKVYGTLAAIAAILVTIFFLLPKESHDSMNSNRYLQRVTTWRSRLADDKKMVITPDPKDFEVTDANRQVVNARIAIARSNGIGVLPGRSVQRDYLSAAYSDFIYAIIAEELGLLGCLLVLALYIILFIRCGAIASQRREAFPAAVAMGFGILLVTQAMVNMAVAAGIFPVTGQPLPLISKGGTSTIITGAYIGIILSVSRAARREKEPVDALMANESNAAIAAEMAKT